MDIYEDKNQQVLMDKNVFFGVINMASHSSMLYILVTLSICKYANCLHYSNL